MSGHSKWNNIKHKKAASDAKKGKVFTQHSRAITVAAREGGGDPLMNATLQLAIDRAKADNLPNDNIERAVKKGTGDLKDAARIEEVVYEVYGPEGVAIIVTALTDNTNRTVANIKAILSKNGGKLGGPGSVSYLFERKGIITINALGDKEVIELAAIDAGAEDIEESDDLLLVYTLPAEVEKMKEVLLGFNVQNFSVEMVPFSLVVVDNPEKARQVIRLLDLLEDDEDVNQVTSNVDISDEVLKTFV